MRKGTRGGGFFMANYKGGHGGASTATGGGFDINPYFGLQPGDIPFDQNVDPSSVVQQPYIDTRSGWDKYKGAPDLAGPANLNYLNSKLSLPLEQQRLEMQNAADLAANKMKDEYINSKIGAAMLPLLEQSGELSNLPYGAGGYGPIARPNLAALGNYLNVNYQPMIQSAGGAGALNASRANIAESQAKQAGMENAKLADLARQPFVSPLTTAQSQLDLRNAEIARDYSNNPQYPALMEYNIANRLAPSYEIGQNQERIFPATGQVRVGPRTEVSKMHQQTIPQDITIGGKKQTINLPIGEAVPTIKYYPGQTLNENVVGRIQNPNPNPPRGVSPKSSNETSPEDDWLNADPYLWLQRRRKLLEY